MMLVRRALLKTTQPSINSMNKSTSGKGKVKVIGEHGGAEGVSVQRTSASIVAVKQQDNRTRGRKLFEGEPMNCQICTNPRAGLICLKMPELCWGGSGLMRAHRNHGRFS